MLGLGAYESSSEDEIDQKPSSPPKQERAEQSDTAVKAVESEAHNRIPPETTSIPEPSGPVLGPLHEAQPSNLQSPDGSSSPFSASRTLVQDLTLPPVPDLDIPPSPPGSPNSMANAKFAHFLSLKKQDVHFNEKLAGSTSLKNPSLLKKLMEHAGLDDQTQYYSSLPLDIWDVSNMPSWGFKEELLKAQRETHQRTEEQRLAGPRDTIDFVAATSGASSRAGSIPNSKSRIK